MSRNSDATRVILGNEVVPIEESFDRLAPIKSFTERYFTPKYALNIGNLPRNDYCVLFHSNRICVVTLAPSHPIKSQNVKVTKVDFQVTNKLDRSMNKMSGRFKHGAQLLTDTSTLVLAICDDGNTYKLASCIPGKLVEINEDLRGEPELLMKPLESKGYIGIILPSIQNYSKFKESLMSQEDYDNVYANME